MIISAVNLVSNSNLTQQAWSRIAIYQNTQHTTNLISRLHRLGKSQIKNAEAQASQIKYCLLQAKEYFDAAKSVTIATRPVLLYYATMSMALAEILLKQTGESRLQKLREQHNCHGLQLKIGASPLPEESLSISAGKLVAKTQTGQNGEPKGTFEIWRRSAREYPIGGYSTTNFVATQSSQKSFVSILGAEDLDTMKFPQEGISMFDCVRQLPYMGEILGQFGENLNVVKCSINVTNNDSSDDNKITIIAHPNSPTNLNNFMDSIYFEPAAINRVEILEFRSGFAINLMVSPTYNFHSKWPYSICLNSEDVYFSCKGNNFNEFGYLYIAMHLAGNFARYYPDIWLNHIEKCSPLAMVINEMCNYAFERLPLLILSELERTYYIPIA